MSSRRQLGLWVLIGLVALIVPVLAFLVTGYLGDPSLRNPFAEEMHMACCNGDTKAVQVMLHLGANVNAPVWEDTTALMWATDEGHIETVKVLLAAGANPNVESSHFGPVASWGASHKDKAAKQITALLKAAGAKM